MLNRAWTDVAANKLNLWLLKSKIGYPELYFHSYAQKSKKKNLLWQEITFNHQS